MNGSRGYSQEALRRLETGTYRGRKQQYRTSEEQTQAVRTQVPALEGLTRSPVFDQTGNVDTANARRRYEQRTNYTPIGRTLSQRDRDVVYNGVMDMFNNNLSVEEAADRMRRGNGQTAAGMTGQYVANKDWEREYGKSLEKILEDSAKNFEQDTISRSEKMGEDSKVASTLASTYLNAFAKPLFGAKAQINTLINPESQRTKNSQKVARAISETSKSAREGVTKNMSKGGKAVYDFITPVTDRLARRTLGKTGHILTGFGTAEDKRENLEDRGITGRKAVLEGLGSGAVDAALDFYGMEQLPALKGLRESGSIGKMLLGGAGVGAGEQAITSLIDMAIDRISNKDKSLNAENVRKYMAQGMSQEDAASQAFWDDVQQVAIDTGSGALFGALMQAPKAVKTGLENIARNYYVNNFILDPDDPRMKDAVDISDLNEYAQEALPQNNVPMLTDNRTKSAIPGQEYLGLPERQLPAIQLPGTNGIIEMEDSTTLPLTPETKDTVIPILNAVPGEAKRENLPNKVVAESRGQNPRLVIPLEGKALQDAKTSKADINKQIKALNNTIKLQEKVAKEGKNKAIRAAETKKLNEMKTQLADLKQQKTAIDRQISGTPTPIIEQLTPDEVAKVNAFKSEVRKVGNMWAGDQGKELAKRVNTALDKYIETGNEADLREYAMELIQLENSATGEYTSKAGNTSRYSDYNEQYSLFDAGTSGLDPIFEKSRQMNQTGRYAPEVTAESMPIDLSEQTENHLSAEEIAALSNDLVTNEIPKSPKVDPAIIDEIMTKNVGEKRPYIEQTPEGSRAEAALQAERIGLPLTEEEQATIDAVFNAPAPQANIAEESAQTQPSSSYWLRILGDDNFLTEQAAQAGVEPEMLRQYAMANMGYGDMPMQTPPPANNVPHMDGMMPGDNNKTSQAYTNTGKHGEGWTEEEYEQHTDPSQFQYESVDEEESVRRATEMRQNEGREGFKERMMNAQKASGAEIDGLMMEWRELGAEARALEAAGEDASELWHESVRVFRKIQQLSTESAQGLQALAKWSRNTPEGMLANAENIINGKTKVEKSKLQEQLDKIAKKNKKVEFSEDFVIQFLNEAEKLKDISPDSREAKEIMARLGKMVNDQLPATFGEKLTSFLMDNMLGNFRTLITRNAGGNVGLNIAEQLVQRPLAAGIDSLLSIKTGQRTQAGLSKDGLLEYMQGFANGIKDEARDYKTKLHTARSGQNTLANAISSNRHVFKGKIMDRLDNLVKQGLSVGDRPFYEAVYKQTLGDYNRLRERGVMGDTIQNMSDKDFELYSKAAAELNALGAVYQQDTMLSKALLEFKGAVGDLSRGILGADILSQFSMPFVKTPANVIERAIDYSPLGAVRNAFRTHKERKNQAFDQNRFANETARNILGTALMGGGIGLAANGIMSGSYSDDKDEKQAQRESGMQEYALNMGDKQMDISWVPVIGSNNVAAAAAYDAYKNGEGNVFENAATGIKAGGQALFDQSMFQGLQRLFGTGESYNTDEGIVGNMANVVKSGLGQGIPSLFRQVGQVIDPYQRDLAYSNEGKSFGFLDNYDLNTLANNVPFLRERLLAPKVSTSGELLEENQGRNIASKIAEDMILPGKVTKVDYSNLNKEASRLKEETKGSVDGFMPKAIRKYVDTEDHTLTNQEWVDYEQRYYKELTDVGTKILKSDFYKEADADAQVKTLKNAYDAVKSAINSEYNGKEINGAAKKYQEAGGGSKGVDAVVKYYQQGAEAEKLGVNATTYRKKEAEKAGSGKQYAEEKAKSEGITTTYKMVGKSGASSMSAPVSEEAKASAKDLGLQAKTYNKIADKAGSNAQKVYNAVPELQRNGLGASSAYYTYADALKVEPNLSVAEFTKTFKAVDTDSSKGIKQDELINYFNNNKSSQQQADKMWKMYGDSSWKKFPVLVDGKFVKK